MHEENAQSDIQAIKESYARNKESVKEMLMEHILEVRLELPRVITEQFATNNEDILDELL